MEPIICEDGWVVAHIDEDGVWFRGPNGSVLHLWEDGEVTAHGVTVEHP